MRMGKAFLCLALVLAVPAIPSAQAGDPAPLPRGATERSDNMKINLTIGDRVLPATLLDSPAARDLAAMLPLTLTLEDYSATEKISPLPRKLSTQGAPAGTDPSVGDITYYSPWGNLAIFYRDFGYARGLVKLGRIESGIETLATPGARTVTIDFAD